MAKTFRATVHLKNVRLSYASLWHARRPPNNPEAEEKFGASFLILKVHPQVDEVRAAVSGIMRQHWGAALDNPAFVATIDTSFRDGATKFNKQGEYTPGYGPDVYFVNSYSKTRPTIVDADRTPLVESDGRPYSGCYVNAFITFYTGEGYGKLRVNAGLDGVQFFRDGEAFGGGTRVDPSMFDDVTGVAPSAAPLQTGNAASFLL